MNLLGLLTLPLTAPVVGVVWIAEQVRTAAEQESWNERRLMLELSHLHRAYEQGELDDHTFVALEDQLLDILDEIRQREEAAWRAD